MKIFISYLFDLFDMEWYVSNTISTNELSEYTNCKLLKLPYKYDLVEKIRNFEKKYNAKFIKNYGHSCYYNGECCIEFKFKNNSDYILFLLKTDFN